MTTIGVLGGRWRATVSATGSIEPWDGSAELHWYIAADDRWHVPADEPTVRQRLIDDTPVVETRLKVPNGDAVQRVWCVADGGGHTVVEIENDSSLPFAVAFNRSDLLSARPAADVPIQGIDLPAGSVVFPVGHRSTVRFALAHYAPRPGALPDGLAGALQVARGWTTVLDRAGRVLAPDEAMMSAISRTRSELMLAGPTDPADDPTGFLLDVGQLVRLGDPADPWMPDVAAAVSQTARRAHAWDTAAALDSAAVVLARGGEQRGLRDLARLRADAVTDLPADAPSVTSSARLLAWYEQRLARSLGNGRADVLSAGLPTAWLGANIEVYGLPIGPATTLSYALRWHGERPAVLWEMQGPTVPFTASAVAAGWSTAEPKGEALWPAPVGASAGAAGGGLGDGGDVSFS